MPRDNDLEGAQDQGGRHGGQKGMPEPEPRPSVEVDDGDIATPKRESSTDDDQPLDRTRANRG